MVEQRSELMPEGNAEYFPDISLQEIEIYRSRTERQVA